MMSFLIGLLAGLFGGLVGLGGGVVMIPLMVRFFGFHQHQAHGTSLMALVFTGLTGAAVYGLEGTVDPLAAGLLAATAILTARFGRCSATPCRSGSSRCPSASLSSLFPFSFS
jgi:uncharacterized protein